MEIGKTTPPLHATRQGIREFAPLETTNALFPSPATVLEATLATLPAWLAADGPSTATLIIPLRAYVNVEVVNNKSKTPPTNPPRAQPQRTRRHRPSKTWPQKQEHLPSP